MRGFEARGYGGFTSPIAESTARHRPHMVHYAGEAAAVSKWLGWFRHAVNFLFPMISPAFGAPAEAINMHQALTISRASKPYLANLQMSSFNQLIRPDATSEGFLPCFTCSMSVNKSQQSSI